MTREQITKLRVLLRVLQKEAPCHGGSCVGRQNCDFGENGCYGETCAIDNVLDGISAMISENIL